MAEPHQFFPSIGAIADQAASSEDPTESGANANDDRPMHSIESLCMQCGEQGMTRLLLTSIPFFRDVIVMSFRCAHCGAQNNEIQPASTIRPEGAIYTARIVTRADLNRQLVRSPTCAVLIPEHALTLPAAGRGHLTTVEGLLRDVVADLAADQPLRRITDAASHAKIQAVVDELKAAIGDDADEDGTPVVGDDAQPLKPFTISLDDPAGNSFIEFVGSMADPKWNMRTYPRTREQNLEIGLGAPDDGRAAVEHQPGEAGGRRVQMAGSARDAVEADLPEAPEGDGEEIYVFPGVCSSCGRPLDTLMKRVIIPYFKDVLIMSTNCDSCGYRDNEVKSGAAISARGKRITLKVEDREDLSRDILKSDTSGLTIPDIDLVLQPGTLGGRFTTLEGILEQVYEELSEKAFAGDSSAGDGDDRKASFEAFLGKLKEVKSAERPFTLILDDPLANSYIQNLYAPDPDPNMQIELYDRTWEQDEELGLNDMKVEGYGSEDGGGISEDEGVLVAISEVNQSK